MDKLKEARNKLGKSQMQVAREIGVHINTYRRYEHGVSNPNREIKDKLEDSLEIKLN